VVKIQIDALMITNLIVGFVFFIFGIVRLSASVQKGLSGRLRMLIEKSVSKPWMGVVIGILVTIVVHSSSATTVLTIAFVNAGIITFFNALGIIFGANIGTTITAQLVAFNIIKYAPHLLVIGFFVWFFTKGKKKDFGEIIFYFGVIFYGLSLIKYGVEPLTKDPSFIHMLTVFENPILGILAAAIFTGIIQSSGVTSSIVVVLGMGGVISLNAAIPLVLGANIGTTVTALIASAGTSLNARRSALAHFFFNVIGVCLFLPFLGSFTHLIASITPDLGKEIALAHTMFNVINVIIFLIFIKWFYLLIKKILPGKERIVRFNPRFINKKFAEDPFGIELASKEVIREAELSLAMLKAANDITRFKKKSEVSFVENTELVVDNLQKEITTFLSSLSRIALTKKDASKLTALMGLVNDIERVADHADNIKNLGLYTIDEKINFSESAIKDIDRIYKLVKNNFSDGIALIKKYDKEIAAEIIEREEKVDELVKFAQEGHIMRLKKGLCNPLAATIFTDLLNNLERVSDHSVNIVEWVESYSVENSR